MIALEQKLYPIIVSSHERFSSATSRPSFLKSMKHKSIIALSLFPLLFVSCANQQGSEDYDVSNPYAAPDYVDATDTPVPTLPSDVNPAYDEAPVYEDVTPAVSEPAYTAPPIAPAKVTKPKMPVAKVHIVSKGDSLWTISKKYGVSINAIKQANAMTRDIVVLGSKLKIPAQ